MKRIVAFLVAFLMVAVCLASCGNEDIIDSSTESTKQTTEENNDPVGVQLQSDDGLIKFQLVAGEDGKAATATLYRWDILSSTITIPETITYNGHEYPITVIGLGQNITAAPSTVETLVLSSNVKVINASAFSMCNNLKTVAFAEGLEKISNSAFFGCSSLTTIELPSTVKTVERSAFTGCASVSAVIIGENTETVEDSAFGFCMGIKTISLPRKFADRVKDIFNGCPSVIGETCTIVYPD